tara:strand:+ start:3492 stop:3731 length:240 start_codon:yes stop_codon:yes gene_type:complete
MTTDVQSPIKSGPPWTVIARFPTYGEAVEKVEEEKIEGSDFDFKIKRYQGPEFRVKRRLRLELMENKKNKKNKKRGNDE